MITPDIPKQPHTTLQEEYELRFVVSPALFACFQRDVLLTRNMAESKGEKIVVQYYLPHTTEQLEAQNMVIQIQPTEQHDHPYNLVFFSQGIPHVFIPITDEQLDSLRDLVDDSTRLKLEDDLTTPVSISFPGDKDTYPTAIRVRKIIGERGTKIEFTIKQKRSDTLHHELHLTLLPDQFDQIHLLAMQSLEKQRLTIRTSNLVVTCDNFPVIKGAAHQDMSIFDKNLCILEIEALTQKGRQYLERLYRYSTQEQELITELKIVLIREGVWLPVRLENVTGIEAYQNFNLAK